MSINNETMSEIQFYTSTERYKYGSYEKYLEAKHPNSIHTAKAEEISNYAQERVEKRKYQMNLKEAIFRHMQKSRDAQQRNYATLNNKYEDTESQYYTNLVEKAKRSAVDAEISENVAYSSWCNATQSYAKANMSFLG